VNRALARYRVIAYVVGVFLLVLVFVAVPLKHLAHQPALSAIVGPLHGLLYMVYLVIAFDLAVRARWNWGFTALVLVAGTVPFLSFVAERVVTKRVQAAQSETTLIR
jgi:integral membrane protein